MAAPAQPSLSLGPTRLEARYLAALPPLYYPLGGLWIVAGGLPLMLVWGTAVGLGEAFGEGVGEGMVRALSGCWYLAVGLAFVAYGGALVATGAAIARRRWLRFCRVMAWLACLFVPFGTLAGVMTILLLRRDGVRALFEE